MRQIMGTIIKLLSKPLSQNISSKLGLRGKRLEPPLVDLDRNSTPFRFLTEMSFYAFLSEAVDAAAHEVTVGVELDSINAGQRPAITGNKSPE